MSKFLTGLVGILVVACLSVIGWALWELFHVNPRWAQLNSEQVAVWAAALATSLSALVTAGSFFFLYQTFRATRKQLTTAQEATELQKIALEAQTRPFLELAEIKIHPLTTADDLRELGVLLKVINHGQSPAVQVEISAATLSVDECGRGRDLLPIAELRELVAESVAINEGTIPGSLTWTIPSVGRGAEGMQERVLFVVPKLSVAEALSMKSELDPSHIEIYTLFVRLKYQSFLNQIYDELRAFQVIGSWVTGADGQPEWKYMRKPLALTND